jgi:chromosome segregation ATPase
LESEIPDQDTLKAKIQVLEERLNSKKEALLEKELVLEEISNITEKMRQQTIDGRKSILELGEKINEFKAKTSELSRQMLATVAELSMYQASALKLEQEKCERENVLTEATDRFSKGMPPTEEDEEEWKRRLRQEEQKDAILVYA